MNDSATDVVTTPWVRVSGSRYVHRSGICFERPRFWKRREFWTSLVAVAEVLVAAWLLSCVF
jgi:hypothetical protein